MLKCVLSVVSVKAEVGGKCSKFWARKNTGIIIKKPKTKISTKGSVIRQTKWIEAIGKLAHAKMMKNARVGMIGWWFLALDDPGDSREAILSLARFAEARKRTTDYKLVADRCWRSYWSSFVSACVILLFTMWSVLCMHTSLRGFDELLRILNLHSLGRARNRTLIFLLLRLAIFH